MLFLELLKWKSIIMAMFGMLLGLTSCLVGLDTSFWHETEGSYYVEYLNDDRNRCKDTENYFFADVKNIYCYSFEDDTRTICVSTEGTNKKIKNFAVWEDDIYYVTVSRNDDEETIWEMCRFNYQSNEQEVVLTNEELIRLNGFEEVDSAGVDVHKGYLFFYTDLKANLEYICPLGEDVSENSVELMSLFGTEGTYKEKQQMEYDGILIERELLNNGNYDITGIWDEQGYRVLYSVPKEVRMAVDNKWVRIKQEHKPFRIQYQLEEDESRKWKDITAISGDDYGGAFIYNDYMVVEDERIIGLVLVPTRWTGYKDTAQRFLKKSILYELNTETGESRILFDTKTNKTTIIGYKDKDLYYIKDEKIHVENMETAEKKELGEIPKGKDYIIDWQGGYLIIREAFTYEQNGDMVFVYETE